jgi:YegS/Rv2252/BmrU family lipid kinase
VLQSIAKNIAVRRGSNATDFDKGPLKRARKPQIAETVLIVNPNSCSGLTGKDWDALYVKIKGALKESPKVVFSKKPGDGTALTRKFLKRGTKTIVAIGGDGTINEVANGFFEEPVGIYGSKPGIKSNAAISSNNAGIGPSPSVLKTINPDAIMAVVPCGTRNVLAKSLDLPEGVIECCRSFSTGKARKIDVISATVTNANDRSTRNTRIFLNAAEIGLAAEIIDRSKKIREVVNSRIVSTITSILATLPAYQSNECEVVLEGRHKKIVTKMTLGIVANGRFLGGGFEAAPRADMSDGFLDVLILKDSGSLKMLTELPSMKGGRYKEEGNMIYKKSRKVSFASKERDVTVTIDGEPIGILPATFEVIHTALTIKM